MDRLAFKKIVQGAPADPGKAHGSLLIALRRFEDSEDAIMLQHTECARKILQHRFCF